MPLDSPPPDPSTPALAGALPGVVWKVSTDGAVALLAYCWGTPIQPPPGATPLAELTPGGDPALEPGVDNVDPSIGGVMSMPSNDG